MSGIDNSTVKNHLLGALCEQDFERILPHLNHVTLAKGDSLVEPDQPIQNCWFLEDGVASVVLSTPQGHETEVGIIGQEGMVDISTLHGIDRSPFRCFIQVPGSAYRLSASALRGELNKSADIRRIMHQFAYRFTVQISGTALANASFTVEQRLARWLLMCHDRLADDNIRLTHEFLALMLNVRRAGVTTAVSNLEHANLVEGRRGAISIRDRRGLEAIAGDCYGAAEQRPAT